MPAPLSPQTQQMLREFLEENQIGSEAQLDLVSHREGRAVGHLHHDGLDYTVKLFNRETSAQQEEFQREHQFYVFLKPLQTGLTPLLLGSDESKQALLLTRIAGRGVRETEVNRQAVERATQFLVATNEHRESDLARTCACAFGACQSISEHLTSISNLVTDLQQHLDSVNPQTRAFIEDELSPVWQKILASILSQFQTAHIPIDTDLEESALILSPGELGFHNTILTPQKDLCFVDFDQSGWDDPARVICQFFTQGPIPPKAEHWDSVIDAFAEIPNLDPTFAIRARILLPAYQIARACQPLLRCLREETQKLADTDAASHSKTKLITLTNRSRQWLIKANQAR